MAYIDKTYYEETLNGISISESEFNRLADIASDIVYGICIIKPTADILISDPYKKAVAYQVEMLYAQGGVDAILGFAEASYSGGTERLGDYSISAGNTRHEAVNTFQGIPVSSMTIMLLKQLGLMRRWAYAWRYNDGTP